MSSKCLLCGIWVRGSMINVLWPNTLPKCAVLLSISCTTLDASGNTFQWMQLRLSSTLLLVAEQTTVIVYYMVCLSAILTSCREFKTQAARLVVMQGKFCHIIPVLHELHWLPVSFRINFKILLLTFKAIHELAPSYINNLVKIKPLNSRYRLRSNDGILLWHPNFKTLTSLGDHAFVASAPKLWNDFTSGN